MESADLDRVQQVLCEAYRRPAASFPLEQRMATAPRDWLVADLEGELCGSVSAADYAGTAYIGMMAVAPAVQRRGVGAALMERILQLLDLRGTKTILLDASDAGAGLYRRYGFHDVDRVCVYKAPALAPARARPHFAIAIEKIRSNVALEETGALDRRVFGCDRRTVLQRFVADAADGCMLARRKGNELAGYLIVRGGTIGPWTATSASSACALLQAVPALPMAVTAFVPQSNEQAVRLLAARGLTLERTLAHMVRGSPSPVRRLWLYGQASLGTG
ncbi:MAG: GNAT family N-acetyltransferase [Candidatus Eremiobacteraeota bacterium]|nr:GNAT family N-acetyltransferase [Candidatus Eremiobacteraeota bacterium]